MQKNKFVSVQTHTLRKHKAKAMS